ncbi:MAG: hypothetical protein Q7T55_21055 [Solirubrobacteraceae bacterium]|nr:hypothetical protein [Solirubrobacteraceae bacterium]
MRGRSIVVICLVGLALLGALWLKSAVEEPEPTMTDVALLASKPMSTAPERAVRVKVDGIGFPDWTRWGWKATGGREDTFEDARTAAVRYEKGKESIVVVVVSGTGDVNSQQAVMARQRTPPSGKVELTAGGVGYGGIGDRPDPAGGEGYLCGNPRDCELVPGHVSLKRKVSGHTVALISRPSTEAAEDEMYDMAVRGFAAP